MLLSSVPSLLPAASSSANDVGSGMPLFALLVLILFVVFLVRVQKVYRFLTDVIELVYNHVDWKQRRLVYVNGPSIFSMTLQFWRPLTVEEWYGDRLPDPGPGEHFFGVGGGYGKQ